MNSDDDNANGIQDLDETGVAGEDDLAEIRLSTTCPPVDPDSLTWSLSWPNVTTPLLQIWENANKTSCNFAGPIENGVEYPWPPPVSLWIEAVQVVDAEIQFNIYVNAARQDHMDKARAKASCSPAYYYARGGFANAFVTGCSAKIPTCPTTLCATLPADPHAHSSAWTGVTTNYTFLAAQIGYDRQHLTGQSGNSVHRYTEVRWGPFSIDIEHFVEPGLETGTHEYSCHLLSPLFRVWVFEYDGLPFHTSTNRVEWVNRTGVQYSYTAEIYNKEDQMVGTLQTPCQFSDLQYRQGWGSSQSAPLITYADLRTDDFREWGVDLGPNSGTFVVWDRIP